MVVQYQLSGLILVWSAAVGTAVLHLLENPSLLVWHILQATQLHIIVGCCILQFADRDSIDRFMCPCLGLCLVLLQSN